MKFFRYIIFLSIQLNLVIGLSIASLLMLTCVQFSFLWDTTIVFFTFFATCLGYSFVKYFVDYQRIKKYNWFKITLVWNFICNIFTIYFFFKLSPILQILYVVLGFLLLLYSIPIHKKMPIIRNVSGLKIYYVALFITVVTVVVPFIEQNKPLSFFYFIQRFLVVLVLILPFEIQAITTDAKHLQTIPQTIGIKKSKFLGLFLLLLSGLLTIFFIEKQTVLNLFFFVVLGLFLCFSSPKKSIYYTGFWVEILPVLWLIVCLIKIKI